MKSFPNPLTASEEKYYIQRYTEGDLEAKHILIERNLRLVAHVIKKYQNLEEDPEDLLSIGTIGLIKAVVTFNPDKGNRLAAYASRCVEKATPSVWLHLTIRRLISTLFPIRGRSGSHLIICTSSTEPIVIQIHMLSFIFILHYSDCPHAVRQQNVITCSSPARASYIQSPIKYATIVINICCARGMWQMH